MSAVAEVVVAPTLASAAVGMHCLVALTAQRLKIPWSMVRLRLVFVVDVEPS
jgi:hypothetical protein